MSAAQEANDPVYNNLLYSFSGEKESKRFPVKRQGVSFSTLVRSSAERDAGCKCDLCHGDHGLFGCSKFKGMKVSDRSYVSDKKLF